MSGNKNLLINSTSFFIKKMYSKIGDELLVLNWFFFFILSEDIKNEVTRISRMAVKEFYNNSKFD